MNQRALQRRNPGAPHSAWRLLLLFALVLLLAACEGSDPDGLPSSLTSPRAFARSAARGEALYRINCAICHGQEADGKGVRQSALSGPPQDFTQAQWRRRTPPQQIYAAIHDGKGGTSMPAWNFLEEQQTWDLVAYLLSVSGGGPGNDS